MKRVADIFLFIRIHKLVEYVGRMQLSFNNTLVLVIYLFGKFFLQLCVKCVFAAFLRVANAGNKVAMKSNNLLHKAIKRCLVSLLTHTKSYAVSEEITCNHLDALLELFTVCHNCKFIK